MPSNYTSNYKLNQWEKADRVLMEDFNADNAKIDAALKAQADADTALRGRVDALAGTIHKIATGTYVGNGEETRFIALGFTPIAVYVCSQEGETFWRLSNELFSCGGLALAGKPIMLRGEEVLSVQPNGFRVNYHYSRPLYSYTASTNSDGQPYHYLAIA